MAAPDRSVVPQVLQKHLEELQFLYGQRHGALRSADYFLTDLVELDERIEAHLDAFRIAGGAIVPLVEEGLSSDERKEAFAAAYALLLMDDDSAKKVVAAFLTAQGERLAGIRDALCHGAITSILFPLREAFVSPPSTVAIAAAEVLAFHQRLDPYTGRLTELITDDDVEVRRAAWRVVAILDSYSPPPT